MTGWLRGTDDGVVLHLHIQPGAKKTEVVGLHGDALKIRLAAPPVDGKANAALLAFLAAKLSPRGTAPGAAKPVLSLISGDTSRSKRVRVEGLDSAAIAARLTDS